MSIMASGSYHISRVIVTVHHGRLTKYVSSSNVTQEKNIANIVSMIKWLGTSTEEALK